jgi:phosphoribosylformimino-5-aminoimidazole carboxamide ribotide isomerase
VTLFRPCIDLHAGRVKQIVGATLEAGNGPPQTHFATDLPAAHFASLYRRDGLFGGHVIQLGPGNREAALAALRAFPGGLAVGGGVTSSNAADYLDAGASHVIVTSFLFPEGRFSAERLRELSRAVGRTRLVLDLSCRACDGDWIVTADRWRTWTDLRVDADCLGRLSASCDKFLVHAVDAEGRQEGIAESLVEQLGQWGGSPITYAGGVRSLEDLHRVAALSSGRVDVTVGSALDLFGGHGVRYADCVAFNRRRE